MGSVPLWFTDPLLFHIGEVLDLWELWPLGLSKYLLASNMHVDILKMHTQEHLQPLTQPMLNAYNSTITQLTSTVAMFDVVSH